MSLPPVAIPTYQRSQTIVAQTLGFLATEGYPPQLVTLFVADEEEKQKYLRDVPSHLYGALIVGVKGLAEQRNFISDYFNEEQIILQLDDDVAGVKTLGESFLDLVLAGVRTLEGGVGLWGVLPNDDGRRLRQSTTLHLTHIIGSIFLCKNHKAFRVTVTEMEDYYRSIWYFKMYGKVARYRGAGVKTTYNRGSGGLVAQGREARILEGVEWLVGRFPDCCQMIFKGKRPDLRLNWRAVPSAGSHVQPLEEDELAS